MRRNERQGINPRILMLDLVVTEPEFGTTMLTEQDVDWSEETDAKYDQVQILVSGTDARGKVLEVQEVS